MNETEQIKAQLKKLKLSGMRDYLETRLIEANSNQLSYTEFLCSLLLDEIETRKQNKLNRLISQAHIGSEATMETFDFKFSPYIPVTHIKTLATCEFLNKGENVIFLGPTGTGKTHLAKALCHQTCRRYRSALFKSFFEFFKELKIMELDGKLDNYLKKLLKIDVLVIDDFAFRKIDAAETELFYYIVDERYQTKSMIFTSNRALSDWAAIFPDPVTANAIMDRLAHSAHQIVMKGESYRSKQKPKITNAKT
jgi:DNA replication protein DnaC